jgi:hypothetical protein
MLTWLGYDEGLESASFATAETTAASSPSEATATSASTSPAAAPPALSAAPAALRPRASFADVKGSLLEYLSLQSGERCHGLGLGRHFHKAKASGLSAVAVLHDGHGLNFTKSLEFMTQVVFG